MKKIVISGFVLLLCFCFVQSTHAQLLKKLKDKANQVLNKKATDTVASTVATEAGLPTNKTGGGLTNTPPPDVNEQMTEAEQAYTASKYSDARFAIQQALIGVEIQLGKEIMKSLPDAITNLPKDTTEDKIVSNQWGLSNLTIQRVYEDGKDKRLTTTIGNNPAYAGIANIYFSNMYVQSNGSDQQNVKQVKVKGNKAIIQYDDSKGYTLMVPLGQTSLIVLECINFASEADVMAAANSFDIDNIKRMLGEQ